MFPYLTYFRDHLTDLYHLAPHDTLDSILTQPIDQCPHILFYGPDGGLKKEYARIAIAGLYGAHPNELHATQRVQTLTINSNKHDVPMVTTLHSIEFWPSEISAYDRHVISEIVKPIISQKNPVHSRHIIVFHDAHLLSYQAMMCLRRMMELYCNNALFIMIADTIGGIPNAIVSRCCLVRCPLLSEDRIQAICNNVRLQNISDSVSDSVVNNVVDSEFTYSRDIYIRLIRMSDKSANNNNDVMYDELKIFMDGLRKCRTPWTIYDRIKTYVHKMLHYEYSTRELFGTLIRYLIIKYGNKASELISLVADADYQLTQGTRPNFIYERLFLGCVQVASTL